MNELEIIEDKIFHLSDDIEKLLNILKITLENDKNDIELNDDIDLKYKKELENYKEDNKNPKIKLAVYIFNLIDNIKKKLCEAVDNTYSKNSYGIIKEKEDKKAENK